MYSLWFLTATLATGAAPEPPTVEYAPATGQEVVPEAAPSLRDRLRNLLHRPPPAAAAPTYTYTQPVQMPASSPYAAPQSVPTAVVMPPTAAPARMPGEQVGHEMDYSWITGQLVYVRTAGGRWIVRYAPLGQVDRYGGSVVLAPTVEMRNFREGDLVRVHGEVLNQSRAIPTLGGALYRVDAIFMVDRASPER